MQAKRTLPIAIPLWMNFIHFANGHAIPDVIDKFLVRLQAMLCDGIDDEDDYDDGQSTMKHDWKIKQRKIDKEKHTRRKIPFQMLDKQRHRDRYRCTGVSAPAPLLAFHFER